MLQRPHDTPYTWVEWGAQRSSSNMCPQCAAGTLLAAPLCTRCYHELHGERVCPECRHPQAPITAEDGGRVRARLKCDDPACAHVTYDGWYRHAWSPATEQPMRIRDLDLGQGDLYHTLQHYSAPKNIEGAELCDFIIDIDRDSAADADRACLVYLEWFWSIGVDPVVYFSGGKGYHLVVPYQVLGAQAHPRLNEHTYRNLAEKLHKLTNCPLDYAIYSPTRLLRVPNSRHLKSRLYKVWLDLLEIPYAREVAKNPKPTATPHRVSTDLNPYLHNLYTHAKNTPARPDQHDLRGDLTGVALPCIDNACAHGPPDKNTRHALYINMAAYYVQQDDPQAFVEWAAQTRGQSDSSAQKRKREAANDLRWAAKRRAGFRCNVMQSLGLCDPRCHLYEQSIQEKRAIYAARNPGSDAPVQNVFGLPGVSTDSA